MITRALLILCMISILATGLCAAGNTVWQIGRFDNSYEDLAIPHDYNAYTKSFPKDVTFTVGKSDQAKDWPFIHPGPSDSWAHGRVHPFQVIFDLSGQPSGVYTLLIDLVSTHDHAPPVVELSVNGQSGRFRLPNGPGDGALTDCAQGREHVITLTLPPTMFRKGANTLTLKIAEGSWMLYDAISLSNDPSTPMPQPTVNKVSLTPTMFLVKREGKLKQIVRLIAECSPGTPECAVSYGDQKLSLKPNLLGIAETDLELDEVKAATTLDVAVSCGGEVKTASCEIKPQRHWRLYVQASSHIDVGYTDWQERVVDLHNRNMSLALDLCKQYPDFVWNTEVAWPQDNYLSMMPKERKDEFIARAKTGQIGCQAIYGNMLTGILSHEEMIRGLYYAHNIAKQYGIPYDMGVSSDVPTQVWTLPTVLAGAGIKYFSAGLNLTRGDSFNQLFHRPFYWQGPDGGKVLTWFNNQYAQAANLGLQASVESAKPRVLGLLAGYDRADYPYDAVLAFGGVSDNQPFQPNLASVAAEWNKRYEYPKIIFTRGPEFFQYVEKNFAQHIPTISGDGGVYWEDGAGSSAEETAAVRIAKEQLTTAEKIYSLLSTLGAAKYPKAKIDAAWKNAILYDEHTWGAHCSISQPEHEQTIHQWNYKRRFAVQSAHAAGSVMTSAITKLAEAVHAKSGETVVYNPLSWPVSGYVRAMTTRGGEPFWVEDVPALGYKVVSEYRPQVRSDQDASGAAAENRFYRLQVDPATGAIRSLYDKELGRELVDSSAAHGINQYVYIKGLGGNMVDSAQISSVLASSYRLPGRSVIQISGSAYLAPEWITEVVLYDDVKRIDFINRLQKQETYEKEAGYFAFPFNLDKPEFYVELPNGVVRPKKEMLPGGCMSWYCAQDFVAAADDRCAVVWSAVESPLITIGDINRETFKSPLPIENGHLYAYAFNNYWFTNYKASQGGEMEFRYSLTSMPKYDPVAASRFGQSVRCPLVAWKVTSSSAPAKDVPTSLVSVSAENVNVQAVKQAESGEGLIIRLRELAGKGTPVTLTLPKGAFKEAWSCNLVEDAQSKLKLSGDKVTVTVPANGLATVWVK